MTYLSMLIESHQDVTDSCKGYQIYWNEKFWPYMPINLPKVTYWTIFGANFLQIFDFSAIFYFQMARKKFLLELRWRNQCKVHTKTCL